MTGLGVAVRAWGSLRARSWPPARRRATRLAEAQRDVTATRDHTAYDSAVQNARDGYNTSSATHAADLADDGGSSARTSGDVFGFIFLAGPV